MLDIPLVIVPTSDLLLLAADICRMHLISPYDAFYVALSQREGLPLLTADERLVHATYSKGFDVRFIGNTLL